MKKKFFLLLPFFLTTSIGLNGWHNTFIRGMQAVFAAGLVKVATERVRDAKTVLSDNRRINPVTERIEQWVKNEAKEMGIPDYDNIIISCESHCAGEGWSVHKDKVILVGRDLAIGLDVALRSDRQEYLERPRWLLGRYFECPDEENIALNRILLRSALKEYQSRPIQKWMMAQALPFASLSLCSALTYFKPAKSIAAVVGYSLSSLLSLDPFLAISGDIFHHPPFTVKRFFRKRAEEFSCQHAQSRLELEMFYKHVNIYRNADADAQEQEIEAFQQLSFIQKENVRYTEFDYVAWGQLSWFDRAVMAKKYLDKWDKEHKS